MLPPPAMIVLATLGCAAPGPLGPDAVLADDPMLRALPPQATVVARLAAPDALLALAAEAGLDPTTQLGAWTEGGELARLDQVAAACSPAGCLALGQGPLAELEPQRIGAPWAAARIGANDVRLDLGPGARLTWHGLGPGKAVVGDHGAVTDLVRRHRRQQPRLDPAPLQGRVPAGDAWVLSLEPQQLWAAAAGAGLDLPWHDALDLVDSLAMAATPHPDRVDLVLRATARDAGTASDLARLAIRALAASDDPRLAGAAVGHGDDRVEITLALSRAEFVALVALGTPR